ncbi:MAG: tetratricopeptide repeat protein [Myxococcota bacterium]
MSLLLPALSSGRAFAEATSSDKAAAEALFDQGVALLRNHQYKEACEKLETSQKIDPAVGTLLYLGECYERQGRTASAWVMFREASSLAQTNGQSERSKLAAQRAERLEPDLAYLAVSVAPEARVPGLVVRRGNDVVKPELFGVSIPMDPGDIQLEASAPGYAPFTETVSVTPREHRQASIPALLALPTPVSNAPALPPQSPVLTNAPPPSVEPVKYVRKPSPLAYVLGGVGIVGLGVGSYFGVKAIQRNNQAKDDYGCSGGACTEERGVALSDQALTAARISNVAFAAGGALLVSGIVLYIAAPRRPETALSLVPTPSGAAVFLKSAF